MSRAGTGQSLWLQVLAAENRLEIFASKTHSHFCFAYRDDQASSLAMFLPFAITFERPQANTIDYTALTIHI